MLTTNVGNAHGAGCHVPGGAAAPQTPHLFIFLVGKLDKNSPTLSAGWHAGCRRSIGGSGDGCRSTVQCFTEKSGPHQHLVGRISMMSVSEQ